jgi:hypothetical protein
MSVNKGGRGNKSPYESVVVRVPKPLQDKVLAICNQYRETGELPIEIKPVTSLSDAVVVAERILKAKKSARVSIERLLREIYREDISL